MLEEDLVSYIGFRFWHSQSGDDPRELVHAEQSSMMMPRTSFRPVNVFIHVILALHCVALHDYGGEHVDEIAKPVNGV